MRCRYLMTTLRWPRQPERRVAGYFLTAGTRSGNSAGVRLKPLYTVVFGSKTHPDKSTPRNDRAGTEVFGKPKPGPRRCHRVAFRATQIGRSRMSNQNQNPGQQNQNPGQKPGQQQGGGQKPGQQQQGPNRQGSGQGQQGGQGQKDR